MHRLFRRFILFILVSILIPAYPVSAQIETTRLPVDMMVLIDNSCSMFPANQILAGCDAWGSDPGFLRIAGANLFIARLGFGEENESEYRLGVISVGDTPELVSPLKVLLGNRDSLAALIAEPKAQPATRIVPALEMAYKQLDDAAGISGGQTPAVVMITDGVPWPRESQSDSVIEDLVSKHDNTPLFIMLLQNKDKVSLDYESYIQFWQKLQSRYNHIFVYSLTSADEIQNTYNAILAQLQNTTPAETASVKARTPLQFYVAEYLEKVVVTIMRQNPRTDAGVTITDAMKQVIKPDDNGVQYFKGVDNPVDVYAISASRLEAGGRGKFWTIQTARDVTVLVDRQGSYQINFLSPNTIASSLSGVFAVVERQLPSLPVRIRFNLLDKNDNTVQEPQPVTGTVILPDGSEHTLTDLENLKPDEDGIYEFGYVLSDLYAGLENTPGRFLFIINAGTVNESDKKPLPVTTARLQLDAGKLPFIRSINPLPIKCEPGQPFTLRVNIGDYGTALTDSIRVTLSYGQTILNLEEKEPGVYQAELQAVCAELTQLQPCSSEETVNLSLQLNAQVQEDYPLDTAFRDIEAQVLSPDCTTTPVPTITPTPVPQATSVSDTDSDGLLDLDDRCPESWGLQSVGGCFPWTPLLTGVGILGLVVFSSSFLFSWVKVRTYGEPPDGYLVAMRDGKVEIGPLDLHQLGIKRRTSRLAVGSDNRIAHIYLPGLKPVEFYIERSSIISFLRDPAEKKGFAFLGDEVTTVHSSDPRVIFKISLDTKKLENQM